MEIKMNPETLIGKLVFAALLLILPLITLCACGGTDAGYSSAQEAKIQKVSLKYITDSLSVKSCWYATNGKDSLKVGGAKYTISARSRYRIESLPKDYLDQKAAKVMQTDLAVYLDTKRDSIYLFFSCESIANGI